MALFRKKPKRIPPLIKIDVGIDNNFTVKEKENIIEAFIRWQDGMRGLVIFHIGNMSVNRLVMHYDDCNTWYAINVIKAYSDDEGIQIEEARLGHIVNGLATFLDDTTFAFVVVDRIKTDEEFVGLVMHEVGHLLGLNHEMQNTIMHKYSSRTTNLTESDIRQLIQVWRYTFGLEMYCT